MRPLRCPGCRSDDSYSRQDPPRRSGEWKCRPCGHVWAADGGRRAFNAKSQQLRVWFKGLTVEDQATVLAHLCAEHCYSAIASKRGHEEARRATTSRRGPRQPSRSK